MPYHILEVDGEEIEARVCKVTRSKMQALAQPLSILDNPYPATAGPSLGDIAIERDYLSGPGPWMSQVVVPPTGVLTVRLRYSCPASI